jgi:glycerophosphoryl diester phosphodiesterase
MAAESWLTARPIAHRGLHDKARGVIENSLSAARAAIEGRYAIECDVQLSSDGEAFVFHDFTLDRLTTEKGLVRDKSAATIATTALAGSSDRIPTLAAFIDMIAGQVPLVVEIKSLFDGDMALTQRTLDVLASRLQWPIVVKSFDPRIVAELRRLAPSVTRGIVAMNDYNYPDYKHLSAQERHAMANLLHFRETRPDFISWRVRDLPSAAPFLTRGALDLPLMTWTVRTPEDRAKAAAYADQMVFEGFTP